MIHLILLSGGSGSRLWPLSNNSRSKQFLKVLRDEAGNHVSMVQRVLAQVQRIPVELDITVATSANQENPLRSQIDGEFELVLEPERRDTAPAIMLACANLALEQQADLDDTVIVMPIDTYADQEYYNRASVLHQAVQDGIADLVLLGVEPTYPSGKYGYIVPEQGGGDLRRVRRFTEKPDEGAAKDLISQGALWNCGVFAFKLGYLTAITNAYHQAETYQDLLDNYSILPKISFDYEVVEKADSVAVASYAGTWKDLGTWNTLTEEMAEGYAGRVVVDEQTCENVHVVNETGFPMVVAGLKDSVVVATPDGILVTSKEASANIKAQVERASESRPMYEQRRWGEYRVIDSSVYPTGEKALTKELIIATGKQLSYQRHQHRSEVWTVVSGFGEIVLDGQVRGVRPGDVVDVPAGTMHSLRSFNEVHIIEVQLGEILIEEDIERFGDFWM